MSAFIPLALIAWFLVSILVGLAIGRMIAIRDDAR